MITEQEQVDARIAQVPEDIWKAYGYISDTDGRPRLRVAGMREWAKRTRGITSQQVLQFFPATEQNGWMSVAVVRVIDGSGATWDGVGDCSPDNTNFPAAALASPRTATTRAFGYAYKQMVGTDILMPEEESPVVDDAKPSASKMQITLIKRIVAERQIPFTWINTLLKDRYGADKVAQLTVKQASELIDALKQYRGDSSDTVEEEHA